MDNVVVEKCANHGLNFESNVISAHNVVIRQNGKCGVYLSSAATMTISGASSKIHHNCGKGDSGQRGFEAGSDCHLFLVEPLTFEMVHDNVNKFDKSCNYHIGLQSSKELITDDHPLLNFEYSNKDKLRKNELGKTVLDKLIWKKE